MLFHIAGRSSDFLQSDHGILLRDFQITFNFIVIPESGSATVSRDKLSILNKTSVNKVTNNINSRLGKGSYTNTDIYKVLADEFNKKQGDKEFMTFWSKASNNSAEDKAEALSPAMLWVQSITRQDVSPSYKAPSLTEVLDMLAERKG